MVHKPRPPSHPSKTCAEHSWGNRLKQPAVLADYSQQRADLIVEAAIKNNNWESQKDWLKFSQATQTIQLVSEAMNQECTDFNQNSTQFAPAMEAIEAL